MNRSLPFVFASLLAVSSIAFGADGLVTIKSPFTAKETMNRLEENAKQRGLTVIARIDHAAGAAKIGKTLRPTEVLIFGNPRAARRSWNLRNRCVSIFRSQRWYGRTPKAKSGSATTILLS